MAAGSKQKRIAILLVSVLAVLAAMAYWFPTSQPQGLWTRLERVSYDARLRWRGPLPPRDDILIVGLDDESIRILDKRLADFSRHDTARVIRNLAGAGAEVIAVDMLLSKPSKIICAPNAATDSVGPDATPEQAPPQLREPDGVSPPGGTPDLVLSASVPAPLAEVTMPADTVAWDLSDPDQDLAAAIAEAGNVILARYVSEGVAQEPLEMFTYGAAAQAIITLTRDSDGVVRSLPLLEVQASEQGPVGYFTLGYQAVAHRLGYADAEIELTDYGTKFGDLRLYGALGNYFINYAGPSNTFKRMSFGRIWAGDFKPAEVAGKIILIGNLHPSAHDFYPTPFDERRDTMRGEQTIERVATVMPGLEIHANVAQSLLDGKSIRFFVVRDGLPFLPALPDRVYSAVWLALIAIGVGIIFIVAAISIPVRVTLFLLLCVGTTILAQWVFERWHVMLQLTPYLGVYTLMFVGGVVYKAVVEGAERARITRTFGQYVSPQVVAELVADPSRARLGGEKRVMTVMFSDIRGFTTMSEKLDPVELVNFLNEYLSAMTEIIFERGGVVDKYMGDAIMAFWGAPIDDPQHAENACATALHMLARLRIMRQEWAKRNLPAIDIGIGLNTGPMTVGNMGSNVRFDYTVMGDSVNLASRLEGINKEYGTNIVISEFTKAQIPASFVCRELDLVAVKGKKEPVRIYELMAATPSPELVDRIAAYTAALDLYKGHRFIEAKAAFEAVLAHFPDDGPSRTYIQRCEALAADPPPQGWDGVYVMKHK